MISQSGEIIIESDLTWTEDTTISQNIRVLNGGTLTLSNAEFVVEQDVNIFVDGTSNLIVNNSEIDSEVDFRILLQFPLTTIFW